MEKAKEVEATTQAVKEIPAKEAEAPALEAMMVNGILMTDPEAIKHFKYAIARETELKVVHEVASTVQEVLDKSKVMLNGRKLIITTGDNGLKAEIVSNATMKGSPTKVGAYPSNIPKPTRVIDPDGETHEFTSNHSAFMWITSTYEVDCDRTLKHNYLGTLQRLGVLEAKGLVDGRDTYKVK